MPLAKALPKQQSRQPCLHANGVQPNLPLWRWRALETTKREHDPNERHYGDPVKYGHCLSAERAAYRPVSEEFRQPKDHLCVQQLWPQEEGRSIGQKWMESAYGIRSRSCVGLISSRPGGAHIHHFAK